MIDLCILQQTPHRIYRPHATRRDIDIRVPNLFEPALAAYIPAVRHAVDALELEGQHFAHVADDQLEAGVGLEEAGGVEAEDVQGGVFVPAPAGDGELMELLVLYWIASLKGSRKSAVSVSLRLIDCDNR